jgi:hypothetical protein
LTFFRSCAAVKGEQNGHAALVAANAEIPPRVGFGPSRNIQRLPLRSEMPQLSLSQGGMGSLRSISRFAQSNLVTQMKPLAPANILIRACIQRNNGHVRFDPDYCSEPGFCSLNVFRSSRMRVRLCSLTLR